VGAYFPPGYLDPDKLDEVIAWLLSLPIDPEDRKRLLVIWCQLVGVVLTEDLIRRIRAEEVL
jgi:hypothetical protein